MLLQGPVAGLHCLKEQRQHDGKGSYPAIVCLMEQPVHYSPDGQQWWDGQQWQPSIPPPLRHSPALWWIAGPVLLVVAVAATVILIVIRSSSSDDFAEQGKFNAPETTKPSSATNGNTPAGTVICPGTLPLNSSRYFPLCFTIRDINKDVAEPLQAKGYTCKPEELAGLLCETPSATDRADVTFKIVDRSKDPSKGISEVSLGGSSSGYSGSGASANAAWSQLQKAASDTLPILFPKLPAIRQEITKWLQSHSEQCINDRGVLSDRPQGTRDDLIEGETAAGYALSCGGTQVSMSGSRGKVTSWSYLLGIRLPPGLFINCEEEKTDRCS